MGRLTALLRNKLSLFLLPPLLWACAGQPTYGPVDAGYYRVQPGDTLGKLARQNRRSVRDLAGWNDLADPDRIEVGQVLRVVPPAGATATAPAASPAGTSASASPAPSSASPASGTPAPASRIALAWPANGPVLTSFNGSSNKGIDIGGQAGDPVTAAAAGKVVYAGNGLRGYGNLIMVQHSGGYLSAYAHNRTLLAKEGDTVRQGQKIAEMGDSDANRVKLHFELRYQGKPLNPASYLPSR